MLDNPGCVYMSLHSFHASVAAQSAKVFSMVIVNIIDNICSETHLFAPHEPDIYNLKVTIEQYLKA